MNERPGFLSPQVPFFRLDGHAFVPTEASLGPWGARSLNGRVVSGLLAREIERVHGLGEYLPARFTVDLYRLSRFEPVTIETRVLRDSHRIRVIEAEFVSSGISIARAVCQLLRRTQNSPGRAWSPPEWKVPSPDEISPPEGASRPVRGLWDVRQVGGAIRSADQRAAWLREVRDLVQGEPLTPFVRVALAADYASPLALYSDEGLGYINSDVTIYLHRLPATPWIGLQVTNHQATAGVAIGRCTLYDESGSIGAASMAALAQLRSG